MATSGGPYGVLPRAAGYALLPFFMAGPRETGEESFVGERRGRALEFEILCLRREY